MSRTELRADLSGADKAVSETLDEVNQRMHGLISGGSYHREFLDWLAERGYVVVRKPDSDETLSGDEFIKRWSTPELSGPAA